MEFSISKTEMNSLIVRFVKPHLPSQVNGLYIWGINSERIVIVVSVPLKDFRVNIRNLAIKHRNLRANFDIEGIFANILFNILKHLPIPTDLIDLNRRKAKIPLDSAYLDAFGEIGISLKEEEILVFAKTNK